MPDAASTKQLEPAPSCKCQACQAMEHPCPRTRQDRVAGPALHLFTVRADVTSLQDEPQQRRQ